MTDKEFAKFLDNLVEITPEDIKMEDEEFEHDFQEWLEGDDEYEVEDVDNDV